MSDHDESCSCAEYRELSRRQFIERTAITAIAASAPAWLPQVAFAQSAVSNRDTIVSIYLRGGSDGLSVVPPFGDPNYYAHRPVLAIPRPDSTAALKAIDLNGYFGFAPALQPLMPAYQNGNLLVVHATGSVDPSRSHFDAQKFMETGKPNDSRVFTGWLGRHLATTSPAVANAPLRGIGFSAGLQRTLAGGPNTLPIPNPASFTIGGTSSTATQRTAWLANQYGLVADPLRRAAIDTQATIDLLRRLSINAYQPSGGAVYPNGGFGSALRATAALIKADAGVEAAHIDIGGWDTHTNQGPLNGGMAQVMTQVSQGLAALHADMAASNRLNRLVVVVMSEFGRVVRENASAGTDHGHGNCMFVMGGGVVGGRVLSLWPGLDPSQLYQNQDLQITIDHRDILAEIVSRRLANNNLSVVFPDFTPTFRGAVM